MVSNQGIKINPDKIKAIEDITIVDSVKAVQRLTGRIAALRRFISRSSYRSHKFFSLLKKKNYFTWTPECQQALEELKRYLSSPPLLSHAEGRQETLLVLGGVGNHVEVGEPSARFRHATEESNHKAMNTSLELLDKKREAVLVRMAA
uniref:Uncharacterized protein LOC104226209 n=1 Tax=Nicotiana sylvestris TaxID=4096 RepID=A0A1U7WGP5_NICSY|nr:PREDICTED: uncharacterized protein LOC104226209 [Nicotiana sylvestris]